MSTKTESSEVLLTDLQTSKKEEKNESNLLTFCVDLCAHGLVQYKDINNFLNIYVKCICIINIKNEEYTIQNSC